MEWNNRAQVLYQPPKQAILTSVGSKQEGAFTKKAGEYRHGKVTVWSGRWE